MSLLVNKISFTGATVDINAISDTHGNLQLADNAFEELRKNKNDVFCKENNIFTLCGDWFMDGAKKGYLTDPNRENAMFQLDILNKFIAEIKKFNRNVKFLFTPGNHEFDGGVKLLDRVLSKVDADVVVSNIDTKKSTAFSESKIANKLFNEKVISIPDDTIPNKVHKILFLGISPVNMSAYQPKLDGVVFTDNVNKPQVYVKKEDYQQTLDLCKKKIGLFKQENPKGIVILMNHTGVNFAKNLASECKLDLILDGHEHNTDVKCINGCQIVSLSQNFERIVNTEIKINDDGKKEFKLRFLHPEENKTHGSIHSLYLKLFHDDIEPKYAIKAANDSLKVLDVKDVRIGNNYLANFITDSIVEELQTIDKSIDFFALNSSSIRHPLNISESPAISNLNLMNVLNGIKQEDGRIMTSTVSGKEMAYLVLDNLLFNKEMPTRNPIIHYAGLSIDKTNILRLHEQDKSIDDMLKYIVDTKTNLPIEAEKQYKIANVEKYFNKSQNPAIRGMKNTAKFMDVIVHDLLKLHFEKCKKLFAKCDIRIR